MRIEIESRSFGVHYFGREEMAKSIFDPMTGRLDAAIAVGIEEADKPIGRPETAATYVEDFRIWTQAVVEKGN
jgi:hypothetical protein